jgi:pimeloyl-ACP methyl ester carboxylesterase
VGALAWLRRHVRAVIAAGLVLLVLVMVGIVATWHFSSLVVIPDHSSWSEKVDIKAVSPGRVVLGRNEATSRPGYYGLVWQAGHAIVGPILSEGPDTVSRRLGDVRGYLEPGLDAGFDSSVYAGNPRETRGLPFKSVSVPDELGPMPAWLIPARGKTWAIVVHGINDDRQVGLRIAPVLHRAGLPTLLISYRDDLGAPNSPDDHHHQGETEWRDLAAAARYALAHGARRLILDGYSMGGTLITQFMEKSPLANRVAALVLDAPALDWKAILAFNAERMGLPGFLALPVEWAIDVRTEPDWDSLDAIQHPKDFHLPILLFHGTEDRVVPISTSDEFAQELGSRVIYFRVPKAGHTQSWNVAPHLYDRRLWGFLLQITPKTSRARPHGSGSRKEEPAATYSPRGLPPKYHRR